jgi:GR25 family glycosyltransferase involved in LPS biosynthesis
MIQYTANGNYIIISNTHNYKNLEHFQTTDYQHTTTNNQQQMLHYTANGNYIIISNTRNYKNFEHFQTTDYQHSSTNSQKPILQTLQTRVYNLVIIKPNNVDFINLDEIKNNIENLIILNEQDMLDFIKINYKSFILLFYENIKNIIIKNLVFALLYIYLKEEIILINENIKFNELNDILKNNTEFYTKDIIFSYNTDKQSIKDRIINIICFFINKNYKQNLFELGLNYDDIFINNIDEIIINKNNINKVDKMLWINLERSQTRKIYMENILSSINIDNQRINAIDGNEMKDFNYTHNISNSEIGCLLSHIKAISSLKDINGDYFMICEDDIVLNNSKLFDKTLEDIIKEAPPFDILLLQKITFQIVNDKYIKWSDSIYGTSCYIITKEGRDKLLNEIANYYDDKINIYKTVEEADKFIYRHLNTLVYKYNFITTKDDQDSTIHNSHMEFHKESNFNELYKIIDDFYFNLQE